MPIPPSKAERRRSSELDTEAWMVDERRVVSQDGFVTCVHSKCSMSKDIKEMDSPTTWSANLGLVDWHGSDVSHFSHGSHVSHSSHGSYGSHVSLSHSTLLVHSENWLDRTRWRWSERCEQRHWAEDWYKAYFRGFVSNCAGQLLHYNWQCSCDSG